MRDWGILQILNIPMQLKHFARMDGPRFLGFLDVFGANLQNAFHYLQKRYSCSYPGYWYVPFWVFLAFWGMKLWLSLVLEPGVVGSGFRRFCQWCWSKKRRFRPDETAEYTKNCWPLKSACGLTARDLKNHPEIRRVRDASRVRTNKTCLEMGGALQVDTSGFPGRLIEAALKPVTVLPQAVSGQQPRYYKRSGKKLEEHGKSITIFRGRVYLRLISIKNFFASKRPFRIL